MLRLVVLAALLGAAAPRLVYEPQADFYGADEITVEVATDADGAKWLDVVDVGEWVARRSIARARAHRGGVGLVDVPRSSR